MDRGDDICHYQGGSIDAQATGLSCGQERKLLYKNTMDFPKIGETAEGIESGMM